VVHSCKYSNAAYSSIAHEGLFVGCVLPRREGICSMEVVRMVLLQCSLAGGTQNLTWMIIMNKITWLMEGFILYDACTSAE
jgi:hypothetical protein